MSKSFIWLSILGLLNGSSIVMGQDVCNPVDSTQYATVYICRPFNVFGAGVGFVIRKGEVKLFKLRNSSIREVKIYQPGPTTLSAKCVDRVSKITVDIELGKSYFISCTPRISYLFANPKLQLVDNERGKKEYQAIVDEN